MRKLNKSEAIELDTMLIDYLMVLMNIYVEDGILTANLALNLNNCHIIKRDDLKIGEVRLAKGIDVNRAKEIIITEYNKID